MIRSSTVSSRPLGSTSKLSASLATQVMVTDSTASVLLVIRGSSTGGPCSSSCSSCKYNAGHNQSATDANCAPCATGQTWWPCNVDDLCYCADETVAPETTEAPVTTEAPTSQAPTTEAPTTEAPTTQAPTTEAPTTEAPTTQAPTTEAPTTQAPTTEAPTTEAPTTQAPTTEAPTTEAPTTQAPTTSQGSESSCIVGNYGSNSDVGSTENQGYADWCAAASHGNPDNISTLPGVYRCCAVGGRMLAEEPKGHRSANGSRRRLGSMSKQDILADGAAEQV